MTTETSSAAPIILPFGETLARTFNYFCQNFYDMFKITSIGIPVFLVAFVLGAFIPSQTVMEFLLNLVSIILNMYISVAVCRRVLLHEKKGWFSFGLGIRELRYFGYTMLLGIMAFAIILVAVMIFVPLTNLISKPYQDILAVIIVGIVGISALLAVSRMVLVLPAVAVDNLELGLKTSWELTRGNAWRLLIGQTLIELLGVVIYLPLLLLVNTPILMLIYSFLMLILALALTTLKGIFYAHAYQYFSYWQSKKA